MKISVCDVCRADGQLTPSRWRSGYAHSVKIDLCPQHRDWARGMGRDEFLRKYLQLTEGQEQAFVSLKGN